MASFSSELQKLMSQFGGYAEGIPNIGLQKQNLVSDAAQGARVAGASDQYGLQKAGMGNSVAGAFSQGNRNAMGSRDAARQIIDLLTRHGQLKGEQRMQMLNQFAPIAYQESQKPSALAKFAGGALGLGANFLIPGLGGGGGLQEMLMGLLGGGGGNKGTGFADTSNFNFGFK